VKGFFALHTFNMALTASTKLYGTIQPNVLGILGLRHTIQPSLSYSYNPDFSKESWGYFHSYRDSLNREVRYDPYTGYTYRPGEIYGGVSAYESQTLGMNLSNLFEMKIHPKTGDTTMTPRKFQLLNLNASANYNFVRDSLRLSTIALSARTNVEGVLDISASAQLSPYVFERQKLAYDSLGRLVVVAPGHEINKFTLNEGLGLSRLTSFELQLGTNISQELFSSKAEADTSEVGRPIANADRIYAFRIPWNLSLYYNYSMSQFDPDNKSRNSNIRASLSFSPTPNWRMSASTYYDFVNKQVGTPNIQIHRDLHCWEMDFDWVPTGVYRRFTLTIRLKAPQLQDIKLEKKGGNQWGS